MVSGAPPPVYKTTEMPTIGGADSVGGSIPVYGTINIIAKRMFIDFLISIDCVVAPPPSSVPLTASSRKEVR